MIACTVMLSMPGLTSTWPFEVATLGGAHGTHSPPDGHDHAWLRAAKIKHGLLDIIGCGSSAISSALSTLDVGLISAWIFSWRKATTP